MMKPVGVKSKYSIDWKRRQLKKLPKSVSRKILIKGTAREADSLLRTRVLPRVAQLTLPREGALSVPRLVALTLQPRFHR